MRFAVIEASYPHPWWGSFNEIAQFGSIEQILVKLVEHRRCEVKVLTNDFKGVVELYVKARLLGHWGQWHIINLHLVQLFVWPSDMRLSAHMIAQVIRLPDRNWFLISLGQESVFWWGLQLLKLHTLILDEAHLTRLPNLGQSSKY